MGLLETGLGVRGVVVPQTAVQEVDRKVAQGPAVEALGECRRTLMYTYVFAYYLDKNGQLEIFEENQSDLEVGI